MAFCPKCGGEIAEGTVFCDKCGAKIVEDNTKTSNLPFFVSTGDIPYTYNIIGPVYFQVSNKGIFSSQLSKLKKEYDSYIKELQKQGQAGKSHMGGGEIAWALLAGEWSVGQTDFDKAFFIAVEELKKKAKALGADAIIYMRQDIDMDTNSFQYFYLQMYGTAVKIFL